MQKKLQKIVQQKHALARRAAAAMLLAAVNAGAATLAQPGEPDDKRASQLSGLVTTMYPELDALYKDLHAHPELAFAETRTASRLAGEMRALGFEVTENVGKTGVVALYRNGPGPTIMVRTDMDGLPMEEKTSLPYASKAVTTWNGRESFVAHSCGHDLHMATWVGAARALVAMKAQWRGTLMFVAQPAEEIGAGARAMLADGLFKRFPKPDTALALHTDPRPYGTVSYSVGPMTSAASAFEIVFKGRGGHGSAPNKALDPVIIAARFVTDVQAVTSREKDPMAFGVITVGALQAGSSGNIIPDSAVLRGTIRAYDSGVRELLVDGVRRVARASASAAAAPEPEITITDNGLGVVNSETVVARVEAALQAGLGKDKVARTRPLTTSEDFAEYGGEGVPSMFFLVGVLDPADVSAANKRGGKPLVFNHSPYFAPVPEPSIKTGVTAMSLAVLSLLAAP
ncbi:amidohydrolase [Cupriavidus basilensis]|uniref:Amidohydrolase n=2 Tax=Cupriavidus basilensis TaxID=68895 RepID=A0A643FWF6_9BURK|nr:amidohydrolase [Cupriavidus basilensis]